MTDIGSIASLKRFGVSLRTRRPLTTLSTISNGLCVAAITPGARIILLGLIGLLLVVLGVLIAMALVVRKRSQGAATVSRAHTEAIRAAVASGSGPMAAPSLVRARASSTGMMAVVASDERVACPTCGQEFDAALRFCPADSRALVPLSEVAERAREGSCACVTCNRAFEMGVRYCPHDASELVPIAVYEATRGKVGHLAAVGVTGRICPACRRQLDLAARFCPYDGTELVNLH